MSKSYFVNRDVRQRLLKKHKPEAGEEVRKKRETKAAAKLAQENAVKTEQSAQTHVPTTKPPPTQAVKAEVFSGLDDAFNPSNSEGSDNVESDKKDDALACIWWKVATRMTLVTMMTRSLARRTT
jgi:hypothetical protein